MKSKTESKFLELPYELIDLIADMLTESDRAALSNTCRQLYHRLWKPGLKFKLNTYCRSIDAIKWLMDQPVWDEWKNRNEIISLTAAKYGHMDVLKWAWSQGYDYLHENLCIEAAKGGHLELLQWLRGQKCPWNVWVCDRAAMNGHILVLQYAASQGCTLNKVRICYSAARYGHLEVLQWLHEQGYHLDNYLNGVAAIGGHLHIVKWFYEQGVPWDESICNTAIEYGHVELFHWAKERGCPWDKDYATAKFGHMATF